jgi:signal transduction histidine kinase
MSRWSLRRRLVSATGLVTVLVVLMLLLVVRVLLATATERDLARTLDDRAQAALGTLTFTAGKVGVSDSPSDKLLDTSMWVFSDGKVVAKPSATQDLQDAAFALSTATARDSARTSDPPTALTAVPFVVDGKQRATVVVAISTAGYDRTLSIATWLTVVLGVFAVGGSVVLAWLLVRTALRPVARMTAQAAEWREQEPHGRFAEGPASDEITGLAETLDALLDRIRAVLVHERRFTAELAHQLRTPLAGIVSETDLALRRPRERDELVAALTEVRGRAARMTRVIDDAMASAEREAAPSRGTSTVGAAVALALSDLPSGGHDLEVSNEVDDTLRAATVGVDTATIARILAPVLENAMTYGHSRIQVTASRSPGIIGILVTDDGPGIDPAEYETIFAPGQRGSASEGTRGAGLGLPLARRLAHSVGAEVMVRPSGTGAAVAVELPPG